jgi:hypothetical protein
LVILGRVLMMVVAVAILEIQQRVQGRGRGVRG